jgi:predicted metal-dependent HD superfamily phosphohydrolase
MSQENKKKSIVEKTENFVTELFKENLPAWAVYHDLAHTIETVDTAIEIGRGSGLKGEDLEILTIAAWLHDSGYVYTVDGHEEKSSEIAMNFLKEHEYSAGKINTVINCIMATKINSSPQSFLESIICDADLVSLGKADYFEKNDLLKLEIEKRENKKIDELTWLKRSIRFLSSHNYFTQYAKQHYGLQLNKNLVELTQKIDNYN